MHRIVRRIQLTLVAIGGVLIGHSLAYAVPGAATHMHADGSAHLHDTMHGYLPAASAVLLPVAAIALVTLLVDAIRDGGGRRIMSTLVRLQVGLFVLLEIAEHIAAGVPVESLIDAPALWLGIAAQILISGSLAAFAVLATKAATVRRRPLPTSPTAVADRPRVPRPAPGYPWEMLLAQAITRRGPPLAAPA